MRANVYGLLARLLTVPPSDDTLEILRTLEVSDDGTEIGQALANLSSIASRTTRAKAEDEFTRLFYGCYARSDCWYSQRGRWAYSSESFFPKTYDAVGDASF